MQINTIIHELENLAPPIYAESFDNVGLLVGDANAKSSGVLVCLDVNEAVLKEAIEQGKNTIVCFHPLIFKGLKKIGKDSRVERCVRIAIKNDLHIYCLHTNLDKSPIGVNRMMCQKLDLKDTEFLMPESQALLKLTTYVPKEYKTSLRELICQAGAGQIGNYDQCSFSNAGEGTFRPLEGSNPFLGKAGKVHFESEEQLQVMVPKHKKEQVLKALLTNHPYETPAYDWVELSQPNPEVGMGMIGKLETSMTTNGFLQHLKDTFGTPCIRHNHFSEKNIKKVAVLGGSGAFSLGVAMAKKCDALVTGDLKYHDFFEAENKILLADIGHYESEQFTPQLIVAYLSKKIPNFAIRFTKQVTNPVCYF